MLFKKSAKEKFFLLATINNNPGILPGLFYKEVKLTLAVKYIYKYKKTKYSIMKKRILVLCVESHLQDGMLQKMGPLAEKYKIIFAVSIRTGLKEIAMANLIDKAPISGVIFQRSTLVARGEQCDSVNGFTEMMNEDEMIIAINMINGDQDIEARNNAVGACFCNQDDWQMAELILNNRFR